MNPRMLLLQQIADHAGDWGWYQLDRALATQGLVGIHLPTEVAQLVVAGLVVCDGDPTLAATRYHITAAGLSTLAGITSGIE